MNKQLQVCIELIGNFIQDEYFYILYNEKQQVPSYNLINNTIISHSKKLMDILYDVIQL